MDVALKVLAALFVLAASLWCLRWGWTFIRAAGALSYLSSGMLPILSRLLRRIDVATEYYPHPHEEMLPYKVYRPLARSLAPAIILYPGASPHGEEHPALDQLARALAHTGLMVFVPRLPQLKRVIIDRSNLESIREFYRHVQGHAAVSPGRISVAGTSFAGGLLLLALLDETMHLPPPKAALTYGTYCDLETTLRFILTGKAVEGGTEISVEPDRWGQVIFFYNYLDHVPGTFDQEQVRAVLNYYVQDLVDEGEAARSTLSGEERRVLDLFLTPSNPESTRLAEKVLQHTRPLLEELSPSKFYSRIDFPVWVLHGSHDSMVPCTEAMALKRLLPRQVRLYLTGLYSHKELGYRGHLWQTVKDALGLIVYFGRFLRAVEG